MTMEGWGDVAVFAIMMGCLGVYLWRKYSK